jgi:TetR/AcrR family transcriptional regulator, transcriptional repressor for nem operon
MNEVKRTRGRPKKSLDAAPDTKAELIKAGLNWLTTAGFGHSSLDSILRSVKVPKGSFYHYFDSKEAFGLEVLACYNQYFQRKLDRHLNNDNHPPLQRLRLFIEDACRGMAKYHFNRGCLVGNLEQEIPTLSDAFRQAVIATYGGWELQIADCLKLAQQQGDISTTADVHHLAMLFWVGWEGAVSRARLVAADTPLRQYGDFFIKQLA